MHSDILITYENHIPWDRSQLLKIWIRGNKITLGLSVCTQNMGITYGNNIPRGQLKITQNLDSKKIRWHWTTICAPDKSEYMWKWYSIWKNQNCPTSGKRLRRASIFAHTTCELRMKMISHGDISRLLNIWIRRKYDYTGPRYFHPANTDYIWKWYSMGTKQDYPLFGFAENTIPLGLHICT